MSDADLDPSDAPPLHPERLTWAVLLGRWLDFARSAIALPTDGDGQRMRESVADVIMLQAVWFALKNLGDLDAAEKALGIDRAEVLVEKHASALKERWQDRMPESMKELIADAVEQLSVMK
ncbi:MAG: hypothetical protein WD768_12735 [Phycisphaeraceae bacterium]